MNPSEIARLSESALDLTRQIGKSPEGFVIAYIAWEALKVRILLVGMTSKGIAVAEAQELCTSLKIWQGDNYNKAFKKYFGHFPNNSPGIGQLFKKADSFKNLRNGFVHGSRRTSPAKFREATIQLVSIVEADWGKLLSFLLPKGTKSDPMQRLQRHGKSQQQTNASDQEMSK